MVALDAAPSQGCATLAPGKQLRVHPRRLDTAILLLGLGALGWLLMQALHEAGHVLHAWVSGGEVAQVELNPLRFSRTTLALNPHPRFVAWGGAAWGCALPLAVLLVARAARAPAWAVAGLRVLAGVCLLANGVYLGAGAFTHAGDAGDLLLSGAWRGTLVASGVVTVPAGLALWHGTGPDLARAPRWLGPALVAAALALALLEVWHGHS